MGYLDLNSADTGAAIVDSPVPNSQFFIYHENSDVLASLYSDEDLTDIRANPVVADASGRADICYLRNGSYRVEARSREDVFLEEFEVYVRTSMETNYLRSFHSVDHLLRDQSLSYQSLTGVLSVHTGALLHVSDGNHTYAVASETATDHHMSTAGGVKLYVKPESWGLNAVAFGADPTGEVACDDVFDSLISVAVASRLNIFVPLGTYRVERGIDFVGNQSISGFSIRLNVHCGGHESTIFFSHGAPSHVIRIDARFFSMSGFSVWGSRDAIRDSDHSAPVGIWVENMREGRLEEFKVAHIVGSGLRIDKCIVSRLDGIIYRCGSDTARAVEQTDPAEDGCQASWVKLNCEDGHGVLGAMKFRSHRNTHLDVKLENQPYYICEITTMSGIAVKDEAVTFSGGATGTVALASNAGAFNGNGQLVLRDVSGAISTAETFTTTSGASGTVKAVTAPLGAQFEASGEYGVLSVFANQNALKSDPGGDIILSGSKTHVERAQVRGPRRAKAVEISGSAYTVDCIHIDHGLTDVANEAEFDWALDVSGAENIVKLVRTANSKGVMISGARSKIVNLEQEELYGASTRILGDYSGVQYADVRQATYVPPESLNASLVHLDGIGSFFGTDGGVLNLPHNATDGVLLSGDRTRLGPVMIADTGDGTYSIRMTGEEAMIDRTSLTATPGKIGIRNVSLNGRIVRPSIHGGATCVELVQDGAALIGGTLSGYSTRGVGVQPSAQKSGIRVENVSFRDVNGSPIYDIQINANVNYSHVTNNNLHHGCQQANFGNGPNNIVSGNIT